MYAASRMGDPICQILCTNTVWGLRMENAVSWYQAMSIIFGWEPDITIHCTLNVMGGLLEIGLNYHITVMFDPNNIGQ